MANRLEMNTVAHHANNIVAEANLVYWLSNSPVDLRAADYHEKHLRDAFEKMAHVLGYQISRFEEAA